MPIPMRAGVNVSARIGLVLNLRSVLFTTGILNSNINFVILENISYVTGFKQFKKISFNVRK